MNGMIYKFTVPDVHGKQRGRAFVIRGKKAQARVYDPQKNKNFEALVQSRAYDAGVKILNQCTVEVAICIPVKVVQLKTKADRLEEPRRRPDLDNAAKSVCDALNGIAYKDDKDVLRLMVYYRFLIPPDTQLRTEVTIREADWRTQ